MSDLQFDGRVAVVTGAGNGLGKTYALELARRGAAVIVNDLGGSRDGTGTDASPAEQVVEEIRSAGGTAIANGDSVSTPEGGEAIIAAATENYGRVDIVINNAGILRDKSFVKMEQADIRAVLDVHLLGAFNVTQPAFKVMKDRGYGRIVFTASNAGVFGNFGQANYGAAKAAMLGLSNVLAIEGAKYGITSNVLMPVARTRLTEELLGELADTLKPELITPLTLFLVSESCTTSQEVFSAVAGRFARVVTGMGSGWLAAPGTEPAVEDIAAHWDEIRDVNSLEFPRNSQEELGLLLPRLQAAGEQ